jgi:hypothetical protein
VQVGLVKTGTGATALFTTVFEVFDLMNWTAMRSLAPGRNLEFVIDTAIWMRQKGSHERIHPSHGNRRTDTAHCRRHSLFRADRCRVAAWCEKRPVNILCQSDTRLDDCRMGICDDMGDDRTERASHQSSFLDSTFTKRRIRHGSGSGRLFTRCLLNS